MQWIDLCVRYNSMVLQELFLNHNCLQAAWSISAPPGRALGIQLSRQANTRTRLYPYSGSRPGFPKSSAVQANNQRMVTLSA
jgi:hypothetical protein